VNYRLDRVVHFQDAKSEVSKEEDGQGEGAAVEGNEREGGLMPRVGRSSVRPAITQLHAHEI